MIGHRFRANPLETPARERYALLPEFAALVLYHLHRQRVEELIGENHAAESRGQRAPFDLDRHVAPGGERIGHLAPARAELDHGEVVRIAHRARELPDT